MFSPLRAWIPSGAMSFGTTRIPGGAGWTLSGHSLLALVQHEGSGVVIS